MWAGEQIKEKYQNGCHLKTISQNHQNSDHHIVGACVHIHNKYKVSMTIYVDSRANKKKVPKLLPFENYKSESLNISCTTCVHMYAYQI